MTLQLKHIAKKLSRYPGSKRFLKFIYNLVTFVLHYHRTPYRCRFQIVQISDSSGGFFGYYDKSPESPDGKFIIYHRLPDAINPNKVDIILYNHQSGLHKVIGSTEAFNYQIGARLQWINEHEFIYNNFREDGKSGSVIYSTVTGMSRNLDLPVYDINKNHFITLNFHNLTHCGSEYGYPLFHESSPDTGLSVTYGNLNERHNRELINEDRMKDLVPRAYIGGMRQHINHLLFAPGGKGFIFIFRWTSQSGKKEVLCYFDISSEKIRILNEEMTSHCCWQDDETVIGFLTYKGRTGYFKINIFTALPMWINTGEEEVDGHPGYRKNIILTDTYPDASRMQHLKLISEGKSLLLGSFYSPLIYNEKFRCDLHPRFNYSGSGIYIDSLHSGKRHLYRINVEMNE